MQHSSPRGWDHDPIYYLLEYDGFQWIMSNGWYAMNSERPIRMSLDDLRQEMHAVLRGERPGPLTTSEPLSKVLAPESIEVLKTLMQHSPDSVRALAKLLGRSEPNVSRTLGMLYRHGFIRMARQGQQVRPVVIAPHIRIDLDCTTGTFTTRKAKPAAA